MFGLDFIYITEMGWETQEEVRALTAFLRSQEVHPSWKYLDNCQEIIKI